MTTASDQPQLQIRVASEELLRRHQVRVAAPFHDPRTLRQIRPERIRRTAAAVPGNQIVHLRQDRPGQDPPVARFSIQAEHLRVICIIPVEQRQDDARIRDDHSSPKPSR
jgi:hypothetical protein